MNEQEMLMRKISSLHPNNCDAARKLEEARKKADELTKQYEATYGPLHETSSNTSRWAWITGPWPWETGMEDDEYCGSMRSDCNIPLKSKIPILHLQKSSSHNTVDQIAFCDA